MPKDAADAPTNTANDVTFHIDFLERIGVFQYKVANIYILGSAVVKVKSILIL